MIIKKAREADSEDMKRWKGKRVNDLTLPEQHRKDWNAVYVNILSQQGLGAMDTITQSLKQ